MTGYDHDFLGPTAPLPVVPRAVRELPSTHFTVLLDPVRRLAAATAVNIDGAHRVSLPRNDDWHFDPRAPESEQTGPHVYDHNDLDRGHLVRRQDPVWGDHDVAEQANEETFSFANAAPQASGFNQGKELWVGLEDHVLNHATTFGMKMSVFTGPVLLDTDPVYRGCGIPRQFWKVAVWAVSDDGVPHDATGAGTSGTTATGTTAAGTTATGTTTGPVDDLPDYPFDADDGATSHHEADSDPAERRPFTEAAASPDRRPFTERAASPERRPFTERDAPPEAAGHRLAAAAFVLDQSPLISGLDLDRATAEARAADDPPPLGPFRTFQVPVSQVAALTGLDLGPAVAADVLAAVPRPEGRAAWITLTSPDDLVLG